MHLRKTRKNIFDYSIFVNLKSFQWGKLYFEEENLENFFRNLILCLNLAISSKLACIVPIAVPAGGAGGAITPPSFEDLGKIKIFRAVRRKYLGKTIVFRAAI